MVIDAHSRDFMKDIVENMCPKGGLFVKETFPV
jgi:hypothetical protein